MELSSHKIRNFLLFQEGTYKSLKNKKKQKTKTKTKEVLTFLQKKFSSHFGMIAD